MFAQGIKCRVKESGPVKLVLMMESVQQTITRVSQELGCSSTSLCVAEHLDRHDELRLLRQEFLIPKISDLPPCE